MIMTVQSRDRQRTWRERERKGHNLQQKSLNLIKAEMIRLSGTHLNPL